VGERALRKALSQCRLSGGDIMSHHRSMSDQANDKTPIISRVLPDGTVLEALFDAEKGTTALAVASPSAEPFVAPDFAMASGERLVPYSPRNNLLATECVLLPSNIGEFGDKRDLLNELRRYLRRYVDLTPVFEDIAAHYILLSWVYDAFNELPYLRFRGDFGTGKTRGLLAVGSVCYKPFFASGASTVSPIFHVLDAFGATLILDEADFRFSDATAELTKILNNGNIRGLPVLRTMTNRHKELNPTAFRVFGPKIVSMRESFSDRALESRFITEETGGRPLRHDIPIHLPDSLAVEARQLRNSLLAWRFRARSTMKVDPERLIAGVSPRLNQTALALLALVDDARLRHEIAAHLAGEERGEAIERATGYDARMLLAVKAAFEETEEPFVSVADVAGRFNNSLENFHLPISNKAVGAIVRRLGVTTTKSRGIYVIPQSERARLSVIAKRFGIDADVSGAVLSDAAA